MQGISLQNIKTANGQPQGYYLLLQHTMRIGVRVSARNIKVCRENAVAGEETRKSNGSKKTDEIR